jgi:hypothetical protein
VWPSGKDDRQSKKMVIFLAITIAYLLLLQNGARSARKIFGPSLLARQLLPPGCVAPRKPGHQPLALAPLYLRVLLIKSFNNGITRRCTHRPIATDYEDGNHPYHHASPNDDTPTHTATHPTRGAQPCMHPDGSASTDAGMILRAPKGKCHQHRSEAASSDRKRSRRMR